MTIAAKRAISCKNRRRYSRKRASKAFFSLLFFRETHHQKGPDCEVHLGMHTKTGELLAVKQIVFDGDANSEKDIESYQNELKVLRAVFMTGGGGYGMVRTIFSVRFFRNILVLSSTLIVQVSNSGNILSSLKKSFWNSRPRIVIKTSLDIRCLTTTW